MWEGGRPRWFLKCVCQPQDIPSSTLSINICLVPLVGKVKFNSGVGCECRTFHGMLLVFPCFPSYSFCFVSLFSPKSATELAGSPPTFWKRNPQPTPPPKQPHWPVPMFSRLFDRRCCPGRPGGDHRVGFWAGLLPQRAPWTGRFEGLRVDVW